jgi:peptide-methionine (S)-S-oxide reductase
MSEIATLAGGCFWCLEAVFQRLDGVERVVSGYMGGALAEPDYEAVCAGETGHAEVIQITFDPAKISFTELLEVFFAIHDPTTLNRQGNDVGSQYRSAIFFHSPEQESAARAAVSQAASAWSAPIVTEITPATTFWPAEGWHQDYFNRNPQQGYCAYVVAPKVHKALQRFAARMKAT